MTAPTPKKFSPGFSKDIEAVTAVFQLGGCTYEEWRDNLRQAGMLLKTANDRFPAPNMKMPDEEEEGYE